MLHIDEISPSSCSRTIEENNYTTEKCYKRCDICKNFIVVSTEFTCHAFKSKIQRKRFFKLQHKKFYLSDNLQVLWQTLT